MLQLEVRSVGKEADVSDECIAESVHPTSLLPRWHSAVCVDCNASVQVKNPEYSQRNTTRATCSLRLPSSAPLICDAFAQGRDTCCGALPQGGCATRVGASLPSMRRSICCISSERPLKLSVNSATRQSTLEWLESMLLILSCEILSSTWRVLCVHHATAGDGPNAMSQVSRLSKVRFPKSQLVQLN